jgi:hypothetical protein
VPVEPAAAAAAAAASDAALSPARRSAWRTGLAASAARVRRSLVALVRRSLVAPLRLLFCRPRAAPRESPPLAPPHPCLWGRRSLSRAVSLGFWPLRPPRDLFYLHPLSLTVDQDVSVCVCDCILAVCVSLDSPSVWGLSTSAESVRTNSGACMRKDGAARHSQQQLHDDGRGRAARPPLGPPPPEY